MFRPPGSEAVESVAGRICSARAHIAGQSPDASVVVVGHGGSLRALFCDALRAPIHCLFGFRLDNASVSVIDYGRTRASIRSVNVTHHLGRLGPGSAR
jgi:broad specificity phosphatase PhoE